MRPAPPARGEIVNVGDLYGYPSHSQAEEQLLMALVAHRVEPRFNLLSAIPDGLSDEADADPRGNFWRVFVGELPAGSWTPIGPRIRRPAGRRIADLATTPPVTDRHSKHLLAPATARAAESNSARSFRLTSGLSASEARSITSNSSSDSASAP